jgi:hypothetical protein
MVPRVGAQSESHESPATVGTLRSRGDSTPAWVPLSRALFDLQRRAGNRATGALLRKGRMTNEFAFSRPKTVGTKGGGWFRKTPRADEAQKNKPRDRPKYQTEWLIKTGGGYGGEGVPDIKSLDAVKEVLAGNLLAELAGPQYTAKTRLIKGGKVEGMSVYKAPTHWVGSKSIAGFSSYRERHQGGEGTVPGLARVLFVALFLGEKDWNWDNFGFASVDGRLEFRRVDMAGFEFERVPVKELLTPDGLVKHAYPLPYGPEHLNSDELAAAIGDVVEHGEGVIKRLAEAFKPEFEGLSAGAVHERLVTQLLGRVAQLRSHVKTS